MVSNLGKSHTASSMVLFSKSEKCEKCEILSKQSQKMGSEARCDFETNPTPTKFGALSSFFAVSKSAE